MVEPNRCTNFSNVFWNKALYVPKLSSVHHHELYTLHTAMLNVIQVLLTAGERDPARKLSAKSV